MNLQNIQTLRWKRILPVTFLMYTIAFMDRSNISFGFAGMNKDLGIGPTFAGLAAGIFFVGYLFLQIPGGVLAQKWSTKKLITIALLVWGTFAILTGFIQNVAQLLILRFLIGFAEGCVSPAVIMMLSKWFPLKERARANTFYLLSIPFASIIMSPICGYILAHSDWRTMFIIEGIPPFIWAIIWWYFIDDEPSKAKWLSKEEREYLVTTLAAEKQNTPKQANNFKEALKNRNVLLLVFVYFLIQVGFYGYSLWLPTVVKSLSGGDNLTVGLLTSLPWIASFFGLILFARSSDKRNERKGHVATSVIGGGILLLISALLGKEHPVSSMLFVILCLGFLESYVGVWWAIPATFLEGEVLGAAVGLINAVGNLGGFFGPFMVGYLISLAGGKTLYGMIFLVVVLILSGILVMCVQYKKPEEAKLSPNNNVKVEF